MFFVTQTAVVLMNCRCGRFLLVVVGEMALVNSTTDLYADHCYGPGVPVVLGTPLFATCDDGNARLQAPCRTCGTGDDGVFVRRGSGVPEHWTAFSRPTRWFLTKPGRIRPSQLTSEGIAPALLACSTLAPVTDEKRYVALSAAIKLGAAHLS
jgi:hypothetical protein